MTELSIKTATTLNEIRAVAKTEAENDLSLLNAAEMLLNVKKFETFLTEYKTYIKDHGINELDQVTEVDGFLITKGNTVRYDYSNSPVWVKLNAALKAHETYLKSIKTPISILDEESGEVTKAYPPIRKESDRITITEKKT